MKKNLFILIFLLFFVNLVYTNEKNLNNDNSLSIVSYNVENLFDLEDDFDNEFDDEYSKGLPTPGERNGWKYIYPANNSKTYTSKYKNLSKVLQNIIPTEYPDVIGLCEVENRKVLEDLVNKTNLKNGNYDIIHEESNEHRGIECAFIYKRHVIKILDSKSLSFTYIIDNETKHSRDFLVIETKVINTNQIIHFIVNHWPSRGNDKKYRIQCAQELRKIINKIFNKDKNANIVLLGDFNDNPDDESLNTLLANNIENNKNNNEFYNLMYNMYEQGNWSYYYYPENEWSLLDQIIISQNLLKTNGYQANYNCAAVYYGDTGENIQREKPDSMIKIEYNYDKKYNYIVSNSFRPLENKNWKTKEQTYIYNLNGYSDHLPVYVIFELK